MYKVNTPLAQRWPCHSGERGGHSIKSIKMFSLYPLSRSLMSMGMCTMEKRFYFLLKVNCHIKITVSSVDCAIDLTFDYSLKYNLKITISTSCLDRKYAQGIFTSITFASKIFISFFFLVAAVAPDFLQI